MSAKYLRNWANIVQILCKYRSIVPTNTKNWTYSNLSTQSSTLAQNYPTIGSMPRVFWGLAANNEVLYVWFLNSETLLLKSRLPLQWLLVLPYSMVTCKRYISIPSFQRHVSCLFFKNSYLFILWTTRAYILVYTRQNKQLAAWYCKKSALLL